MARRGLIARIHALTRGENSMPKGMARHIISGPVAFLIGTSPGYAHHVMDYALPATWLDGFLSGLGHPVIGLDHFLFIAGAGILAAQWRRGYLLPVIFVAASLLAAAARAGGAAWELGEVWVAASLVVLGAVMLITRHIGQGWIAALFAVSGAIHGYALGQSIVGAEATPLLAYFAGLLLIQCAVAIAAWICASWIASRRPRLPLRQAAGTAVGAAGLIFVALAAL
jgi:urease accessory protein